MMAGDSGVGKSWVASLLALSVAAGTPFLGEFPTIQCGVLLCDAEQGEGLIRRRFKRLFAGLAAGGNTLARDLPVTVFPGAFRIDKAEHVQSMADFLRHEQIGLVICDPLIHSLPVGACENDSVQIAQFFESIRRVQAGAGVCFVFTHHSRKRSATNPNDAGQMLRGSSAIRAILDSHLFVRPLPEGRLLIEHDKLRVAEPLPSFVIEMSDPDDSSTVLRYCGEAHESGQDQTAVAAAFVERALTDAGGPLKRQDLLKMARAENVKQRTLDRAIGELEQAGVLAKDKAGKEVAYVLRVQSERYDE